MTLKWTEVADGDTLQELLGEGWRKTPRKLIGRKTIELPISEPMADISQAAVSAILTDCPRASAMETVVHRYVLTCVWGHCGCSDTASSQLRITVRQFVGLEHVAVGVPESPCGHRGDWGGNRVQEYASGLTTVRNLSDGWGHDRYPTYQSFFARFLCESCHP